MHYFYTYINHPIEKLQEYLDFLFLNVWYNATGVFDVSKLDGHLKLKQIYIDLGNNDSKGAYLFNSSVENIYNEFTKLSIAEKNNLKQGYLNNNNVELLCKDKATSPILYSDIKLNHPVLHDLFKAFFGKLYGSESPFNLKKFGQLSLELIQDHWKEFIKINEWQKCPFCGISNLKGENHSFREAYDHFLPKALYPFNSINMKNLAPMCNDCNSTYKKTNIPINDRSPASIGSIRQKAYYPYSKDVIEYELKISVHNKDIQNLKPKDIDLHFDTTTQREELNSWKSVYGIEERYKAMLCHPKEGKVWISSLIDEIENAEELKPGITFEDLYKYELRNAKRTPISSYGFLKAPFLEECKAKGVFDHVKRKV